MATAAHLRIVAILIAATAEADVLVFRDGTSQQGRLIKWTTDAQVEWQGADDERPRVIQRQAIQSISLSGPKPVDVMPDEVVSAVVLTNDDVVAGKLVKVDDRSVSLVVDQGELLVIRRSFVRVIVPFLVANDTMYRGPRNLEEWIAHGQDRQLHMDGQTLVVRPGGSAVKNMPEGRDFRVQFNVSTKAFQSFQAGIGMVTHHGPPLIVMDVSEQHGMRILEYDGNRSVTIASISSAQFGNRTRGLFDLQVDGSSRSVQPWDLEFSKVQLMPLSGAISKKDEKRAAVTGADIVSMTNQDIMIGRLVSVQDNVATVAVGSTLLSFALDRIRALTMCPSTRERAPVRPGDVRLAFGELTRLTLNLERVDANMITGESAHFGRATFCVHAPVKVECNIHETASPGQTSQ